MIQRIPRPARQILLLLVLTRLALTGIGCVSRLLLDPIHGEQYAPWIYSDHLWLDIWGVWDTGWYLEIAEEGYSTTPRAEGAAAGQKNLAFFPLYPLLARAVSVVTAGDAFLAGLLLSNVCLIVICFLFYRLTRLDWDEATSTRAVKYLLPVSYTHLRAHET